MSDGSGFRNEITVEYLSIVDLYFDVYVKMLDSEILHVFRLQQRYKGNISCFPFVYLCIYQSRFLIYGLKGATLLSQPDSDRPQNWSKCWTSPSN